MNLSHIIKEALEEHCKEKGHSPKLTKLLHDLVKVYRNSGQMADADLASFLERIQKEIKTTQED